MGGGKFIIVDGCEGSGKTTILKWFAETALGKKFLITHEPGGTPYAEEIRNLILHSQYAGQSNAETQFGLQWAQRAEHLKYCIKPTLNKGVNVVSDRFDSSTFAYQICAQKARYLEKLFWQTREVFLRERKPDLYIFFDVDPKIGLERVASRKEKKTHFDRRELAFHKQVRAGFLEFLKYVPHEVIDANQSI